MAELDANLIISKILHPISFIGVVFLLITYSLDESRRRLLSAQLLIAEFFFIALFHLGQMMPLFYPGYSLNCRSRLQPATFDDSACAFMGFITQFGSIGAFCLWMFICALIFHTLSGRKYDIIRKHLPPKLSPWVYYAYSFIVSSAFCITTMAYRAVSPSFYGCYTDANRRDGLYTSALFSSPNIFHFLLGSIFLILAAWTIFQDAGYSGLFSQVRLIVYSLHLAGIAIFTNAIYIWSLAVRRQIGNSFQAWVECKAINLLTNSDYPCPRGVEVPYAIERMVLATVMIVTLMGGTIGILHFVYFGISKSTVMVYRRLYLRLIGIVPPSSEQLSSSTSLPSESPLSSQDLELIDNDANNHAIKT